MWKLPDNIKVIKIDKFIFTIESFYDDEFSADRYSYSISYPGGSTSSAGYGCDNEIIYSNFEIALDSAIISISTFDKELYKKLRREINLDILLND